MREFRHLVRRFVWTLRARPLTPREQAEAHGLLRDREVDLFWEQPSVDQRHGLTGARRVLRQRPGDRALARAALLHDVGKRHSRLGIIGRSLASGVRLLGLRPRRWRAYYDHGPIGARELEEAGAEEVVVAWARAHAGRRRPADISQSDWELLKGADEA